MSSSLADLVRGRTRPVIPVGISPIDGHPDETVLNRLAHRQLNDALFFVARSHARGRLVDIGCGEKPYRDLLAPFVTEHVGVDHSGTPHRLDRVDVTAGAYEIPLGSASFDTALLTEVLEHLEDPGAALRETYRLLRPGGKIILTTPFAWVLHETPRDFYRYTPYGLQHLLTTAGFADVSVFPIGGQWSTLALLAGYALGTYRRGPLRWLLDRIIAALQFGGQAMDQFHFRANLAWDHVAVAVKP